MIVLTDLIRAYEKELQAIEDMKALTDEVVLGVVLTRDQIHALLNDDIPEKASHMLMISKLDNHLKRLAPKILAQSSMPALSTTRSAPASAWWWNLDQQLDTSTTVRFFNAATILLAVFILGLVLDIAPRFTGGGSDTWGMIVIALQGLTVVFAIGTLFNSEKNGAIDVLLVQVGISTEKLPRARFMVAILVTLALLGFRAGLPAWSQWDNNQGSESLKQGNLQIAETYFDRALRLNANNYQAHYNLGALYETLGDSTRAQAEYTFAAKGGLDSAYNNLGRLLILQGDTGTAVRIVNEGLTRAQDPALLYYLHKNLGWARLKQERFNEAVQALQAALGDAQTANVDGMAAHCLLAQASEALGKESDALDQWFHCKATANVQESLPEVDEWMYLAEQRLRH